MFAVMQTSREFLRFIRFIRKYTFVRCIFAEKLSYENLTSNPGADASGSFDPSRIL